MRVRVHAGGTAPGTTVDVGAMLSVSLVAVNKSVPGASARIIHDGSSRNRAVAMRDRRAAPRGREAYLKQYVDRPSGEPACLDATPDASRLVAAANPRLQQKCS